MNGTPTGYTTAARMMHWTIAVLVLLMILAGIRMTQQGISRPLQDTLFIFHKNTGLIVFALMIVRLVYRRRHPPPDLPSGLPAWQLQAATWSHRALYTLLFVMPISGYIRVRAERFPIEGLDALGIGTLMPHSKALTGAAQTVHYVAAMLLILLILVHIGAALQHAVIRKDGVFDRMWPPVQR